MKAIRTILIVDDIESILKSHKRLYEVLYNVHVLVAPDFSIMRELLTRIAPDLVLMDGQIGTESGADGIKILRQWQVDCPVVTHSDTPAIIEEMIKLGAIGSLPKPSNPSDLERILKDAGYELAKK